MKLGVFTGLAGLDIVYYQQALPSENQKSKTNDYHVIVGGPAANAAITYAMLGGNPILVTCIGHSEFGKIIKKQLLEDYGVEIIDFAEGLEVLPNISGISINRKNGNRTIWSGQQLYESIGDTTNDKHYIDKEIDLVAKVKMVISKAEFCFTDCNLPDVSVKVLQEAKKRSKSIILDAGSWKENSHFYLSVAEDAIASAVCIPPTHNHDFMAAAMDYGVRNIAVTNGEDEIKWKSQNDQGSFSPPQVEAIDTLGAGDLFHGAYCYFKFMENLSFQSSLEKAAEVASLSVKYFGPREGVREYLQKSGN